MPAWPEPVSLQGSAVRLEPLRADHHDDLVEAVRDGELWKLWYTSVPTPEGLAAEIERRLGLQARGSMLPFAVIAQAGDLAGRAVGMTTYMNIDAPNRRLEIGSTWYRRAVQRSALNTQAKRLLLAHAFETLDCIAVEFRTHFFNHASRRGIERLGARLDAGRVAALARGLIDWKVHGRDYAQAMQATARALAEALHALGLPVHAMERGATQSHQLALQAARWGGGQTAARHMARAGLLACGIGLPIAPVPGDINGLRLGVPEIVRLGMGPAHMPALASLIGRALGADDALLLADEVAAFRAQFSGVHYVT